MKPVKVAVAQLNCVLGDWRHNVEKIAAVVNELRDRHLILFPEMMVTGYDIGASVGALCSHEEEWVVELRHIARENDTTLIVGMPRQSSGQACYNASMAISPKGGILGVYDKTHLYAAESQIYEKGVRFVTVEVSVGQTLVRCGLEICYDIEFPEVSRWLAKRDAGILCVSSANMFPWDTHHYVYTRSRAMENQVFLMYSNRVGDEGDIHFCGGSVIVGPSGAILDSADVSSEMVLKADLNLDEIDEIRNSSIPYWQDRREELYGG